MNLFCIKYLLILLLCPLAHSEENLLLKTLTGHTNGVESVSFSPDGKYLASGSRDGIIKLWNVSDGSLIRTFEGHNDSVHSVSFSPDGRYIASGSDDKTVRLWDTSSGVLVKKFKNHKGSVYQVVFSNDGRYLFSGGSDKKINIWDVNEKKHINNINADIIIDYIALSTDNNYLIIGDKGGIIKVWDLFGKVFLKTVSNDSTIISISDNGEYFITKEANKIKILNTLNQNIIRTIDDNNDVISALLSKNNEFILLVGFKNMYLWSLSLNSIIKTLEVDNKITALSFSKDENYLASGTEDGVISIWHGISRLRKEEYIINSFKNIEIITPDKITICQGCKKNIEITLKAEKKLMKSDDLFVRCSIIPETDYIKVKEEGKKRISDNKENIKYLISVDPKAKNGDYRLDIYLKENKYGLSTTSKSIIIVVKDDGNISNGVVDSASGEDIKGDEINKLKKGVYGDLKSLSVSKTGHSDSKEIVTSNINKNTKTVNKEKDSKNLINKILILFIILLGIDGLVILFLKLRESPVSRKEENNESKDIIFKNKHILNKLFKKENIENFIELWSARTPLWVKQLKDKIEIKSVNYYEDIKLVLTSEYMEVSITREMESTGDFRHKELMPWTDYPSAPPNFEKTRYEFINNKKESICPICFGKGEVTCPTCNGQGKVKCSACGGSGVVNCKSCGGIGYIKERSYDPYSHEERILEKTCSTCNGRRTTECQVCNGNGNVTCPQCGGRREVTCRTCNGTGRVVEYDLIEIKFYPKINEKFIPFSGVNQRYLKEKRVKWEILKKMRKEGKIDTKDFNEYPLLSQSINELILASSDKKLQYQELQVDFVPVMAINMEYKKRNGKIWIFGEFDNIVSNLRFYNFTEIFKLSISQLLLIPPLSVIIISSTGNLIPNYNILLSESLVAIMLSICLVIIYTLISKNIRTNQVSNRAINIILELIQMVQGKTEKFDKSEYNEESVNNIYKEIFNLIPDILALKTFCKSMEKISQDLSNFFEKICLGYFSLIKKLEPSILTKFKEEGIDLGLKSLEPIAENVERIENLKKYFNNLPEIEKALNTPTFSKDVYKKLINLLPNIKELKEEFLKDDINWNGVEGKRILEEAEDCINQVKQLNIEIKGINSIKESCDLVKQKYQISFKNKDNTTTTIINIQGENDNSGILGEKYKLIREIGRGGMGIVYEGISNESNKRVAIKKMKEELSTRKRDKNRFLREARISAKLNHQNIVAIYDIVEDDKGKIYLIFEYVDGYPLSAIIDNKGKLSLEETKNIIFQVCNALGYAHSQGIVHRDIKPSNIMIARGTVTERNRSPIIKVLDFGIARVVTDTLYTMTGIITGTPAYMAPEQHIGEGDQRVDIYSLGGLMYEMLTGELPFHGADVLAQKREMVYRLASELVPDLPKQIDNIINKCLQSDKEKRYKTIDELLREMR
jgi:WD40 repeat protein/tRNA A-37 threonylcarbamoyl transferase component Bud32